MRVLQFLSILTAIEAEAHCRQQGSASSSKQVNKSRDLRGWSVPLLAIQKASAQAVVKEGKGVIIFFYEA